MNSFKVKNKKINEMRFQNLYNYFSDLLFIQLSPCADRWLSSWLPSSKEDSSFKTGGLSPSLSSGCSPLHGHMMCAQRCKVTLIWTLAKQSSVNELLTEKTHVIQDGASNLKISHCCFMSLPYRIENRFNRCTLGASGEHVFLNPK